MLFQRIEDLRIDSDKTQQEIADMLGCKREVYRRYEKGTYDIPIWALLKTIFWAAPTPKRPTPNNLR